MELLPSASLSSLLQSWLLRPPPLVVAAVATAWLASPAMALNSASSTNRPIPNRDVLTMILTRQIPDRGLPTMSLNRQIPDRDFL